jgi:hypothetical protein
MAVRNIARREMHPVSQALRDHVIAPILAGIRSPRMGRKPTHWTRIDRNYEALRINMHALFHDLGITTGTAAA